MEAQVIVLTIYPRQGRQDQDAITVALRYDQHLDEDKQVDCYPKREPSKSSASAESHAAGFCSHKYPARVALPRTRFWRCDWR